LSEDAEEEEEAAAAAFAPADTRAAARGCFACFFWGGVQVHLCEIRPAFLYVSHVCCS
jgi:hypothetical protein